MFDGIADRQMCACVHVCVHACRVHTRTLIQPPVEQRLILCFPATWTILLPDLNSED